MSLQPEHFALLWHCLLITFHCIVALPFRRTVFYNLPKEFNLLLEIIIVCSQIGSKLKVQPRNRSNMPSEDNIISSHWMDSHVSQCKLEIISWQSFFPVQKCGCNLVGTAIRISDVCALWKAGTFVVFVPLRCWNRCSLQMSSSSKYMYSPRGLSHTHHNNNLHHHKKHCNCYTLHMKEWKRWKYWHLLVQVEMWNLQQMARELGGERRAYHGSNEALFATTGQLFPEWSIPFTLDISGEDLPRGKWSFYPFLMDSDGPVNPHHFCSIVHRQLGKHFSLHLLDLLKLSNFSITKKIFHTDDDEIGTSGWKVAAFIFWDNFLSSPKKNLSSKMLCCQMRHNFIAETFFGRKAIKVSFLWTFGHKRS